MNSLEQRKAHPHLFDPMAQGHRLTVAYRGTGFSGWQQQAAKRTVQGEIETVLAKLWGEPLSLQGSGRTDTGVHGLGQVASFNAPRRRHTGPVLQRALNANLPHEIRIVGCRLVASSFHARFDAIGKTYRYLVFNRPVEDPFAIDLQWHVPRPLDIAAMRRAARHLLGRHDFAAFTSNPGYKRTTTVRTMRRASLSAERGRIAFHFSADGFLFRMVRNLVGGLVQVGQGRLTVAEFEASLRSARRSGGAASAPAHGLYLMHVQYPRARR